MSDEHTFDRSPGEIEASEERLRAEASSFRATARKDGAEAAVAEIALPREERKRSVELAGDEYAHVYRFVSGVAGDSVKSCITALQTWSRLEPGCDITIVFTSPGGDIISGMALFDFLLELREKGHRITAVARGYAASMAGILLQAADHRVIGSQAWLLIHEASFHAAGSMGDVEDTVEWIKRVQERILDVFAARSSMSKAQIRRRWTRRDWWLSADDALKHGFVDEIR